MRTANHITRLPELWTEVSNTIRYIIKESKNDGTLANKARLGSKKIDWKRGKSYHSRIKKYPIASAPQLASMVADMFHKEVHPELCQRILRNNDFHDGVPQKKPYIKAVNHKKDWLLQKPILIKIILFAVKSSFRTI